MKKGVDERIVVGIVSLIVNDIILLFDLVTGLYTFNTSNLIYICPVEIAIGFIIGKRLSRNYDKEDNYDRYFCIILGIIGLLSIVLAIVLSKRYKTT